MKKKKGETENEVYTLQELCSNDRELMKQIKSSNSGYKEIVQATVDDFNNELSEQNEKTK